MFVYNISFHNFKFCSWDVTALWFYGIKYTKTFIDELWKERFTPNSANFAHVDLKAAARDADLRDLFASRSFTTWNTVQMLMREDFCIDVITYCGTNCVLHFTSPEN